MATCGINTGYTGNHAGQVQLTVTASRRGSTITVNWHVRGTWSDSNSWVTATNLVVTIYGSQRGSKTGNVYPNKDFLSDSFTINDSSAVTINFNLTATSVGATGGTPSSDGSLYVAANVSAPSAPASISVSPQYFYRGQAITWSWPAVDNAEYYNVSYQYANPSNSGSGYDSWSAWSGNTRINTNQFTESWNNSIYKAGMRCQYAVQAVNSAGGSTWTYPTAYGYLCGRIDIKTSTGWKHGIGWINVGGTWKRAKCVWMNVRGTWKRGY